MLRTVSESTNQRPGCNLYVIFARDAPVAAVLRRGPSRWYQVTKWRTDIDEFEPGAWIKGHIYEYKCDLSPDGELLSYFCLQGAKLIRGELATDSWAAISRLPWLKAIALWRVGTTYGSAPHFVSSRVVSRMTFSEDGDVPYIPPPAWLGVVDDKGPPAARHGRTYSEGSVHWAGTDHGGHTILARDGCLYRVAGGEERLLHDFRVYTPKPEKAPDWAVEEPPSRSG